MTILTEATKFAQSVFYSQLSAEVIEIAKRALIDYIGVTLAGSREPVSANLQAYGKWIAGCPESRVFGTHMIVPHNIAALINGTAAHALDYDDVSWTTIGHPTVTVGPAVFAAGEAAHSSGMEALKAYIVGVEIEHKIASLVMPKVSSNGWHTTSVFGPFGAATASSLMHDLDFESFRSALGIAASKSSGIRSNFGTMTKAYHAGMAAFNGTTASILARLGVNASENAIEGQDGFVQAFAAGELKSSLANLGQPWDIVTPGLVFKRYPCCSGAHPALDCVLQMLKETPFTADEVSSIHVGVSLLGPRELVCHSPTTVAEARFSMEYALAVAVVYGKAGLAQYTPEAMNDVRVKRLVPRISMEIDSELAALGFIGTAPAKLRITLEDGRTLEGRCDLATGNPEKPLSDSDLTSKFMECASRVLEPTRSRKLLDMLFSLDEIEDINLIADLCVCG